MRLILSTLTFMFILSCALSNPVKYSHEQNGKKIYVTSCDGEHYTIAKCHQRASKVCLGQYKVAGQESYQSVDHNSARYDQINGIEHTNVSQTMNRTLLFFCTNGEAVLEK